MEVQLQSPKLLNPALQDPKVRELQKKKLSFDEFTKMQGIVKEMLKTFPSEKNNWGAVSSKFRFLIGKAFPDSRDAILGSRQDQVRDFMVLAVKISKNRPEVYLLFYNDNGKFEILDEGMLDLYLNEMFDKPDWSVFWPMV
jgi:hypothetical protein